jgi:hypothetical protein
LPSSDLQTSPVLAPVADDEDVVLVRLVLDGRGHVR